MPEITVFQIIKHSPPWVFGMFAAVVTLGLMNTRTREVPRLQLLLLPVAFIGLSAWGIWSAFGAEPAAISTWLMGLSLMVAIGIVAKPMDGVAAVPGTSRLRMPGSWWPLVLILATFVTRYTVAVMLIRNPALRHAVPMEVFAGLAYGVLSGLFVARVIGAMRAATQPSSFGGANLQAS